MNSAKLKDKRLTYKNQLYFYIQSEKEIKKIIPQMIASKTIKYLEINLTKEVEDLYTKTINTAEKNKRRQKY